MKICKNYIKLLLVCVVMGLPCFVSAGWKDYACDVDLECKIASKNYSEPYCVTNFFGDESDKSDVDYAKKCIWPSLTNNLSVEVDRIKTKDLIKKYCDSMLGGSDIGRIYFAKPSVQTSDWDWQQTFDSHQSLFVYALCSSFTESGSRPFIPDDNVLLSDVYKGDLVKLLKLEQKSEGKNLCSLDEKQSLDECDMAIYSTKIYTAIMSDLFKIKYAQVLDVDRTENFDSEWIGKIQSFMSGYMNINTRYEEMKNDFPKTLSVLKSNQKYYKKILETVKILDNSKLASLAEKSTCPAGGNMIGMDFVACALHSSQGKGFSLTPSFVTLFYNEILNYRQFVNYYQNRLTEKKEDRENNIIRSLDFKGYFDKQMEATKLVQRNFEDFSMTYPLHIAILLITERGEKFRNNSLSKVITSFYSLSEKLQNVQKPN